MCQFDAFTLRSIAQITQALGKKMYKVEIYKTIWADELPEEGGIVKDLKYLSIPYPEFAAFKYVLNLPFVPYVGLSIIDEQENYQFRSGTINNVTWFADQNMFGCWVKDGFPYRSGGYDYDFDYLVERCNKEGWQLIEAEEI